MITGVHAALSWWIALPLHVETYLVRGALWAALSLYGWTQPRQTQATGAGTPGPG